MQKNIARLSALVVAGAVTMALRTARAEPSAALPSREPAVQAIVVDWSPLSTVYVGTADGLAVSEDQGRTWTRRVLDEPGGVTALAIDPRDPSIVWAGTDRDIRRTGDRGVTWTTFRGPPTHVPPGLRRFAALFDFYADELERAAADFVVGQYRFTSVVDLPGNPPIVIAGATGVLRSTDGGGHWSRMSVAGLDQAPDAIGIAQLVRDPHDARTVWAVTDGGLVLQSRDAGATWHKLDPLPPGITSLVADVDTADTLYAGTLHGSVVRSTDGAASWTPLGSPVAAGTVRSIAAANGSLFASVVADRSDGGLFRSVDGGTSWTRALRRDWATPAAIAVDPRDARRLYAGGDGGLWATTDGGVRWRRVRLHPTSSVESAANLVPTAFSAEGLMLTFSVTNAGNAAVPPHAAVSHIVYLSADDVLSGDDHVVGYARWSEGVASGATYTLQVGLAAPPVPIGRYFLILQVDGGGSRHVDDAASVRAIPFAVTTDLDTQLRRLDALYAQDAIGAEEYAREREELRQILTPPPGW